MAATVQLIEKNGAGGTPTDKSGSAIRFKNADNAAVDLSNPMVKPTSGSDWSVQKWLRLNVTGGSYSQITNVKAYTDGTNGLGAGVNVWAKAVASYVTPAEETSSAGYTGAFVYTTGSPLSLGAGPFTGTGEKGDHLVLAMEVTASASSGVTPAETLTLSWDEI